MNKIDFIGFIECKNANPNGDINMDNAPRQNDNGYGYMTDVCIKRRIKDCAALLKQGNPNYNLYIVSDGLALESKATNFIENSGGYKKISELSPKEKHELVKRDFKGNYFDIRTFGGVITTFIKDKYLDGQIRGAVQISFAETIEEIYPEQVTISRVSIQTQKDAETKKTELAPKWIVPYGVYMFEGHINPFAAEKNGFAEEDKKVLFEAIMKMYDHNQSASSTGMSILKLYVFEHQSKLGDCSFRKIKDAIKIEKNDDTEFGKCPYNISVDESILPEKIAMTCFE